MEGAVNVERAKARAKVLAASSQERIGHHQFDGREDFDQITAQADHVSDRL